MSFDENWNMINRTIIQVLYQKERSTSNFTGVMGKITVGSDGKAQRPLVVNTIKDNQMNFVVKVY